MRTARTACKAAAVLACAALIPLAAAPVASADDAIGGKQGGISLNAIDSYMTAVVAGFKSSKTNIGTAPTIIDFYDCRTSDRGHGTESTQIQLINYNYTSPNENWEKKTFTACFSGGQSHGEWTGRKGDDLYFQVKAVNGNTIVGPTLTVKRVHMW
ncbi:hypothetical protein B046DRAFT_05830 [Streptomyces sp. LamerLS-316]|nr:hypothetical protein B046DRAFT_05830 [Streptomyces sp. LamerLS-316]